MKFSNLALASALAGLLSTGTAFAQVVTDARPSAQPAAYDYNSYYQDVDEEAGSKERGVEEDMPVAAPAAEEEESFGNGAGTILNPCCCLGEPCLLMDHFPDLKCRNINLSGFLAWNPFIWNTSNPADRFNGPVTFTDRSNDIMMNQLYLYAEKTTDTGGCGWDYGWRGDILFGSDYRFTTAAGLETRGYYTDPRTSTQRFYGTAFPQFYFELAVDDLKVKMGHWYAPVGYEVVMATGNFFPSVPYTFQYGEPFTMSGVLATYQYSEKVTFGGGINDGWDNWDPGNNPHVGAIATYTEAFDDGASLGMAFTFGNEPTLAGAAVPTSFRYLQTIAYSRPLNRISDRLTYVAQSDFGMQDDYTAVNTNAKWYGLNQYLFYKVSDCMTYGVRAEWFRDQDGTRVGGFLGTTPTGSLRGLDGNRSGYAGSFYEVTFGANYKYSANTVFRPYVRFDWFSGTSPSAILRPFDNGTGNSQTLIGFDMITVW